MLRRLFPTAILAAALAVVPAHADLGSRIANSRGKDHALQHAIGQDSAQIHAFEGRIGDLQQRLNGLQQSLDIEQAQLKKLQGDLRAARARLLRLKTGYVRDRRLLAAQLIGQYEQPHPDLVNVILNAHGFVDLLETGQHLKAISDHNAAIVDRVKTERVQVSRQAATLARLTTQQQDVTAAALVQRNEVDELRMSLVNRQSAVKQSRAQKLRHLATIRASRKKLENELASIQARAAGLAGAGPGLPSGGAPAYASHAGFYGFFPAAGTNYSVGDEPTIAARLDVMGKALHLHLIGLSGYRSPQHSVEVGGFANDPHTRGQASDTPGLEGVPEATLEHYGLTRPFGGAAEADHVQLVGSSTAL